MNDNNPRPPKQSKMTDSSTKINHFSTDTNLSINKNIKNMDHPIVSIDSDHLQDPMPENRGMKDKSSNEKRKRKNKMMTKYGESICYSTEEAITGIDVTPDGRFILTACANGSIRLFDRQEKFATDRYGYHVGHLDECLSCPLNRASAVRLKITNDGLYAFIGSRNGPKVLMAIKLTHFHSKSNDDMSEGRFKFFFNNLSARGFADVVSFKNNNISTRKGYYILTGLGIGKIRIWRFLEPRANTEEAEWSLIKHFDSGGSTINTLSFLPPSTTKTDLFHVVSCPLNFSTRVWTVYVNKPDFNSGFLDDSDNAEKLWINKKPEYINLKDIKDLSCIRGQFGYGISGMGNVYRAKLMGPETGKVEEFILDDDNRGINILELVTASEDGDHIFAMTNQGQLYYENIKDSSNSPNNDKKLIKILPEEIDTSNKHPTFPSLAHLYVVQAGNDKNESSTESIPILLLAPNFSFDSEDSYQSYLRVEPLWKLRRSQSVDGGKTIQCKSCRSTSIRHWSENINSNEFNIDITHGVRSVTSSPRENNHNILEKREQSPKKHKSIKIKKQQQSIPSLKSPVGKENINCADIIDKYNEVANKVILTTEQYKELQDRQNAMNKRMQQILKERDRRLETELKLRRFFNKQEQEAKKRDEENMLEIKKYKARIVDLNEEIRSLELRMVSVKDEILIEKSKSFNEGKQKHNDEIAQYNKKIDNILNGGTETMSRSQLFELNEKLINALTKNTELLKNADEKTAKCIVCQVKNAVTAIYPCGHLCFCEEDTTNYRFQAGLNIICPICQGETLSLLRIYNP